MADDNGTAAQPLSVLVIEDEMLIAFMLEDFLTEAGHAMVGPCGTLADAREVVESGDFDAALVDLSLPDGSTEPVIDALAARGIPFAIMSGRSDDRLASRATSVLAKPFTYEELSVTLARLAAARG